jgi:hypothetical protein
MARMFETSESSPTAGSQPPGYQRQRTSSVSSYSSNGMADESDADSLVDVFDWGKVEPIDPVVTESPRPADEPLPSEEDLAGGLYESRVLDHDSADPYGTIHLKRGALFPADPTQSSPTKGSPACARMTSLFNISPGDDDDVSASTPHFAEGGRSGGTMKKVEPDDDKSRPELLADLFATSEDTLNIKSRQGSLMLVKKSECLALQL